MDTAAKFALGLAVVGFILLAIPTGSNGSTIFSTFFGSPWISGLTGSSTSQTGATQQQTLLASGTVNFKMALVASYSDNSANETIFERSSLPGLAVVTVHGHPLKTVTAYAVAAIQTNQPLPSGTIANFYLNFSAYIPKLAYQHSPLSAPAD